MTSMDGTASMYPVSTFDRETRTAEGIPTRHSSRAGSSRHRLKVGVGDNWIWVGGLPFTLFAFFFSMRHGLSWKREQFSSETGEAVYWQLSALLILGISAFGAVRFQRLRILKAAVPSLILAAYLLGVSFLSISPQRSVTFTVAFVAAVSCYAALWQLPERMRLRMYLLSAIAILSASAYLFATMPWANRTVGGIPPNQFSHGAAVAIFLAVLSRSRFRWPLIAAALVLLIHADSRTAMAASVAFFGVLLALNWRANWGRVLLSALAAVAGVLVLLFLYSATGLGHDIIHFLSLDDPGRGFGSGFTHRTTFWDQTSAVVNGHQLLGLGIQTRNGVSLDIASQNSLHSAVLNAYAEIGIVGCVLLIWAIIGSAVVWVGRLRRRNLEVQCALAYFAAMLPTWILQPTYVSFWEPDQVLFWFFFAGALVPINWRDSSAAAGKCGAPRGYHPRLIKPRPNQDRAV